METHGGLGAGFRVVRVKRLSGTEHGPGAGQSVSRDAARATQRARQHGYSIDGYGHFERYASTFSEFAQLRS